MRPAHAALLGPSPSALSDVFYNQAALKPPKSHSWRNAAPDALADVNMADLTTLYGPAPALGEAGERGLATDAMTGIQALERQHPMGLTHAEENFMNHMARPVASAPEVTRWHCVADNLHMHQSEGLVRLVAAHDKIADALGHKGTRGMLRSMSTRAAFLADPPIALCATTPRDTRRGCTKLGCGAVLRCESS
jgi:hypothetical protein